MGSLRHRGLTPRFNEARADSPGRYEEEEPAGPERLGFNEARADSPGRFMEGS